MPTPPRFHRPPPPGPGEAPRSATPSTGSGIGDWVVLKNNQLLAFNKPPGLAVQSATADAPTLQRLASAYAKRDLYLIHRIDQPASGLVLFARHRKAVQKLQAQFASREVRRVYLAVVEAPPEAPEGELRHHLVRDGRSNKSAVVEAGVGGAKEAVLTWRQVGATERYPILGVELQTGRHHQIRAQLAAVGAPVHGDVKYGARRANADRGIHLHARELSFRHPVSGEAVDLTAALPGEDALWAAVGDAIGGPHRGAGR